MTTQERENNSLQSMRSLLFKASELERYAHSLAEANRSIAQLGSSSPSSSSETGLHSDELSGAQLLGRAKRLESLLVTRAHETVTQLLSITAISSDASSGGSDKQLLVGVGGDGTDNEAAGLLRIRIVGHVVRIFNELGRSDVLQSVLADTVVSPLARLMVINNNLMSKISFVYQFIVFICRVFILHFISYVLFSDRYLLRDESTERGVEVSMEDSKILCDTCSKP